MCKTIGWTIAFSVAIVFSLESRAAVIYSTAGSTYSQDFDTLPNTPENVNLQTQATPRKWIDDVASPTINQVSLEGWYLYHPIDQSAGEGGTNGHQRLRIGAGTANTGSFMSFGTSGSTDRALGDVGSTTLAPNPVSPATGTPIYWALRLNNGTGQTLTQFTLTYAGEQWRDGTSTTAEKILVDYTHAATTDATNWANQTAVNPDFTAVPALTFNAPLAGAADTAVNGNVAGRTFPISTTVTGISWAAGTDLWIRFNEPQVAGNDDGLGIDDLTFSADAVVPEPASLLLAGFAIAGLWTRRTGA